MKAKKLYRSSTDKVIFGVCGGLAEYFSIDSIIVRLLFAFFTLAGGAGVLIYVIMALVVPSDVKFEAVRVEEVKEESDAGEGGGEEAPENRGAFESVYGAGEEKKSKRNSTSRTLGVLLLGAGAVLLLRVIAPSIDRKLICAIVFLICGLYFFFKKS